MTAPVTSQVKLTIKPPHLRELTRADILGFMSQGENLPPILRAFAFTALNKLSDQDAHTAGNLCAELIDSIAYGETETFCKIFRALKVPETIILMFEKYLNDINSLQ